MWHFKRMFEVQVDKYAFFNGDSDIDFPEEIGQQVQAIIDETIKKLDKIEDESQDGDKYNAGIGNLFFRKVKGFVQIATITTYTFNNQRWGNMDLVEWLKCLDDFELELLKPYLSIELMREICK